MPLSKQNKQIAIVLLTYAASFTASGLLMDTGKKCGGTDRWGVKVLSDKAANQINFSKPRVISIVALQAIETESYSMGRHSPRCEVEKQVFTIKNVKISKIIKEEDDDLHLVLQDSEGHTLIAEIPYCECDSAMASGVSKNYKETRNTVLAYKNKLAKQRFNVTGVAFIDLPHATPQKGVSPNNIEIHPVLNIEPIIK